MGADLLLFEDLLLELLGGLALCLVDGLLLLELDVERVLEDERVQLINLLIQTIIFDLLELKLLLQLLALVELGQTLLLELIDRDLHESNVRRQALRVVSLLKLLFLVVAAEDDELLESELNLLDLGHVDAPELILCQMLLELLNLVLQVLNLFFVPRHRVAEDLEDVLAGLLLGLRREQRLAQVLDVLAQNRVLCLQPLGRLCRGRLGGRFKPLWRNLALALLLNLLGFELVDVLAELLVLVVQQVQVLLEGLVFLGEHFYLVFQVLNVLIGFCLAQLGQDVAVQLFSATRVLVQHRGTQVVLVLAVLDQRVHFCA